MEGTDGKVEVEAFHGSVEETMETTKHVRRIRKWVVASSPVVISALGFGVRTAAAGGFGIAGLDAFLTTFATGVTGMGILIGGVGLAGYIGSQMDNPFSTILAGSINFFTKAGILGGGTAMLGTLGLVAGATF
jgi:hypothetical protein